MKSLPADIIKSLVNILNATLKGRGESNLKFVLLIFEDTEESHELAYSSNCTTDEAAHAIYHLIDVWRDEEVPTESISKH